MKVFFTLFSLAICGWWVSGPSSDETILYYASCANCIHIRPLHHYNEGKITSEVYEKYLQDHKNCVLLHWTARTYKLNVHKSEVYYQLRLGGGPERLVKCAILNNKNWRCEYPDGSGHMAVVDGLEAIKKDSYGRLFSLYRWQYWYVAWHWMIRDEGPTGMWLIPEQEVL